MVSESTFTPGQTLAKVPIFSGLTEIELSFLAHRAIQRHYLTGESVFGEGEPCSGLYIVESGHVRIFKSSASGREQVFSIDGPGGSIAELPVFDGGSYPASATAMDDATLLFVSKQDFQATVFGPSPGGTEGLGSGRLPSAPAGRYYRGAFHSLQYVTALLRFCSVSRKRTASVLAQAWKSHCQ